MIEIGGLYKNKTGLFLADKSIGNDINELYVLCYNVFLEPSNENVRGSDKAYRKIGKPFVLSFDELDESDRCEMQCADCLFHQAHHLTENSPCVCFCQQHTLFTPKTYVGFVPDCKLFRSIDRPYKKGEVNICEIVDLLNNMLNGYDIGNSFYITKNDIMVEPHFGFLNGLLSDESEFETVFGHYSDDKITIIKNFWTYKTNDRLECYTIDRRDFDYTFYMHDCVLTKNAYLFEKSNEAVIFHGENVYVFPINL